MAVLPPCVGLVRLLMYIFRLFYCNLLYTYINPWSRCEERKLYRIAYNSKYALSIKWACTIYLTASLQLRQLMFSPFRAYLVNQGSNPVRYGYLLLLCKTMLIKITFLPINLVHNRHSYYICTQIQTT